MMYGDLLTFGFSLIFMLFFLTLKSHWWKGIALQLNITKLLFQRFYSKSSRRVWPFVTTFRMSKPKILFPVRSNYTPVKLCYLIIDTDVASNTSPVISNSGHMGIQKDLAMTVLQLWMCYFTPNYNFIFSSFLFFIWKKIRLAIC